MLRNGALAGLLVALLVAGLRGQSTEGPNRFELFNDCKPMTLEVASVSSDMLDLGITEANVRAAIESRLRAARVHSSVAPASLHIAVGRYAIKLAYRKPLQDFASGETKTITTYVNAVAVRDGTAVGVVSELSTLLENFLADYLRINGSACSLASPEGEYPLSSVGGATQGPRLIYKVEPTYTAAARDAGLEGTVVLALEIWEDGQARNIRIVCSLGLGLDERAIEAVLKWRFEPAEKEGKPFRVAAEVQISFRLDLA